MTTGNSYPLAIGQTLPWKTRNFPDSVYSLEPGDNLTLLLSILLGNSGTGQLSMVQTSSRITEKYPIFSDLENILGQLLGAPRAVYELYSYIVNPFTDQLSTAQWRNVVEKDAAYRERLLDLANSYLKGGSVLGVRGTAEATYHTPVQVIEKFTSASGAAITNGWSRSGLGSNEIILVPVVPSGVLNVNKGKPSQTVQDVRQIAPLGTIVTIVSGISNFVPVPYTSISGNSEYFYLERTSTVSKVNLPTSAVNNPDYTVISRYWLRAGVPTTAPYFAYLQSQETSIDLTTNISTVNVTTINLSGLSLQSITTQSPLSNETLTVTSTVFGAQ